VQAIEWNLLLEGTEDVSNSPVPKKLTGSVMKSSFILCQEGFKTIVDGTQKMREKE
jgi:hypothetical protein